LAGLDVIHQAITTCQDCDLCQERTNAVPGEGSAHAGIMFVGEGPGLNEDKQGRPFIGAAGQFLTHLLESIGLRREDVFITNMVKCRPPNNRDPLPEEMEACRHYLDEQIAEIAPKIIVPLGRHALARWFPGEAIGKLRAQPKVFDGITLFPLYHPAAALHNGGLRSTIEEDFAKLGTLLAELGEGKSPAQASVPVAPVEINAASESLAEVLPDTSATVVAAAPKVIAESEPAIDEPELEPGSDRDPGKADEPPSQQLTMF
jgi:uracil-DNA glycosylase family 4